MKIILIGMMLTGSVIYSLVPNYLIEKKKVIKTSSGMKEIISSKKILSGDIVFRLGHGFVSETFRKLSQKDQRYSHAGIISIENGNPFVYHLIGGESEVTSMRKETLEEFCKPANAQSFALYRTLLDDSQRRTIDSLNHYYYHCALPFDNRFDLTTDSAMYCTEYVFKILSRAAGGKILITSSMLSGFRYIGCDDIYLNPAYKKIFAYSYNKN